MVHNIGSSVFQSITCVFCFCHLLVHLGVFNDIWFSIFGDDKTDRFLSFSLSYHFGGDVDTFICRETDEDWVCNFDQAIVDTVGVDVFDAALSHIVSDFGEDQCLINTTVTIRCDGDLESCLANFTAHQICTPYLSFGLHQDLAIIRYARQYTLLKYDNVLRR